MILQCCLVNSPLCYCILVSFYNIMAATWSDNENVTESSAGIDDSWTFWHGLWPPLSLKGLSGNRQFPTSTFTTVVKYNSLYTRTPEKERLFTCLFALIITFSFSTLTWNSKKTNWHDRLLHNRGIIKTPPLLSDDTYWDSFSLFWWNHMSSGL